MTEEGSDRGLQKGFTASLPSAQLVECLCQSSWDVSDPSFSDFLGIAGKGAIQGEMEAADWPRLADTLEVMLHHRGSSAPARPPAAPRAPCAPCPMALPAAPKRGAARRYPTQSAASAARHTRLRHEPASASATDQGRSWRALGPGAPIGVASAQASRLPGPLATEPCAPHAQA